MLFRNLRSGNVVQATDEAAIRIMEQSTSYEKIVLPNIVEKSATKSKNLSKGA